MTFVYAVPRDLAREAFLHGLWVVALGLAITAGAVLLLGYISNRASALADEVSQRRSAEERLKVLIHELNHRVRNVMSVAQAVVRLSFTPGLSLAEIQKTCEGRLQALAQAMSMLTASDWRSVGLLSLMSEEIIPFAGRIEVDGPDIALRARSAQTFALLFYELATNAAKHGALSVPDGKVQLQLAYRQSRQRPGFPSALEGKRRPEGGDAAAARLRRTCWCGESRRAMSRARARSATTPQGSNTNWKRRCGN